MTPCGRSERGDVTDCVSADGPASVAQGGPKPTQTPPVARNNPPPSTFSTSGDVAQGPGQQGPSGGRDPSDDDQLTAQHSGQ